MAKDINNGLSKEQQEAIDNYGKRIKTLADFQTAVRKRVGMYLGPINSAGLKNMMREIFQNAVDQILDANSPCNWFYFFYDERTLEVIVEDNGLGFPFNDIIRILTTQHTSKNFEKKLYDYSSGLNGVGSKIVNAVSKTFVVESYRYDGSAVRVEFEKGYPKTKEPVKIPNKDKKQGSKVMFIPDEEILGDMNLSWKEVYKLIKDIMSLTPLGSRMDFEAIDIHGKRFTESIINKDGIVTNLIMNIKRPIIKPIVISNDDGIHKLDCAFCYDTGEGENGPDDNEYITAYSNFCPTLAGTHISGTIDGICRWFSAYMNNIYLINQKAKNKLKVIPNDIKCGLNVMIAAAHLEPNFTGQAKEILSNVDMEPFCRTTVMKALEEWSKANPQDLLKMSKFFKDVAELRAKAEAGKAKIVTKYQSNVLTGLPAKYIRPLGKEHIELLIVEGDSALGTAHTARDSQKQGLLPIRGKIKNAFGCSKQVFFSNEEVQSITRIILGRDYYKGFKPEDCKVEKIIFMTDADFDGYHIASLLERMFIMYFPQLIEAGMVYKAVPPLYSIKEKGKMKYFTEQVDIVKYNQKMFLSQNSLKDLKNKPLDNKIITLFFMRNTDYIYHLERIANTYALNPYLLEMVLYHYILNNDGIIIDKLNKEIKSKYRFMKCEKEGKDSFVIDGVIEKSNLMIFNKKFIEDCIHIIKIMKSNDQLYYNLNNNKSTVYEIMKLYNSFMPSNLQRYKGLGEMQKEQLRESTMVGDRTLVRYTMQDAKETLETIRRYESNKKQILDLVGEINREDLLD